MVTIGLHIIAKDEKKQLINIIDKYLVYFDEVCIAIDDNKVLDELKRYWSKSEKIRLFPYKWCNDFAHKRNFLMSKATTEYIFRLDTDDEILNPEHIRAMVNRAEADDITVVSTYYEYARDEWGNVCAAHYRETIIRNTPDLYWNKKIHENILPVKGKQFYIVSDDSIKIKHNIDKEHSEASLKRNFKYLVDEYNKDKEKTDPRTLAYLGRSLMGMGDNKRAVWFLEKHIAGSGWDEDRYLSWCQMSHMYRREGNHEKSLACAFEALAEKPEYPDAYFEIHDTYFNQSKYQKAIEWGVMGFTKHVPKTNMLIDPSNYTWRPMLSMAACYFEIGDIEKAKKLFDKARTYVPTLDYVKEVEKSYEEAIVRKRFVEHFTWILSYLKDKDKDKIPQLIASIPKLLDNHEIILKIKNEHLPPKTWDERSVVIFCGTTWEPWTPDSIESGIGGSEEAVIHLTRQLARLHYKVTVYNDCGVKEGVYDGVEYKHYMRFNRKDRFNILVSWRCNIFSLGVEARRKIVWVHDLPINLNLEIEKPHFDKIVVLSQYHKTLLPKCIPEDKIYVSTNGLVPEDFQGLEKIERNPYRLIYASSYNRGLEHLLDMWGELKKKLPKLELHIFYGWDMYDRAVASGDVKDEGWKTKMLEKMNQPGILEHGRIGHKQLLLEYAKSNLFAYYCDYAGEINCIALSKAIACGCYCITNDKFAVGERNPHLIVKTLGEFKQAIIENVKDYKTTDIVHQASWAEVAKDWSENLFPLDYPTEVEFRLDWILNQVTKEEKLLDIGCANQALFGDDHNVTRVDIDNYPNLKNFTQANAESLPFKDKSFDTAVLGELLEHTKNPKKAIQEAIRVANRVIITVPWEHEWVNRFTVPFDTLEQEEKDLEQKRDKIYKDSKDLIYFKDDNYEHLRHRRWYEYDTFKKEIEDAGCKNYKIVRLRFAGISHLGAVIN